MCGGSFVTSGFQKILATAMQPLYAATVNHRVNNC